jgi:hypothetical protein
VRKITLGDRKETAATTEKLAKLMEEHEKRIAEVSRSEAERYLAQLEDGIAKLCDDNHVAEAAIQLITERSSHIPPYTPEGRTGWYNARRDYEEGTATVGELYGSLTRLLGRVTHEPDGDVGVSVSRILASYHPDLRFRLDKRKHGR